MISKRLILILTILLTLFSCDKNINKGVLDKEERFTLPIGNMENELDFFTRDGISFSLETDILMKDGLFYISNGNGKKIMKFNSYGDLLLKISPSRQSDSIPHDENSWSFNEPGVITKNDDYIYIVDSIKYDTALSENYIDKSYDTTEDKSDLERHILNEQIISFFDDKGNYINYIGKDGLEGTPFPFINDIYSDHLQRIIVVTQTTYFWSIYRFTKEGEFIDESIIDLDYLPQLENEEDSITQINNIIPDREKDRVLVELTFYKKTTDEKTGATISMDYIKSRVYYYDLNEQSYISWMDIPVGEDKGESTIYVLHDIVKGKYLYFIAQTDGGKSQTLTITNENGYIIGLYDLNIDNSNIIYSSFYTTYPEGILTGLLCTEYAAGINMWRTDKILIEDGN
ncbi:hypothetical protein EW093_14060 [Thiospirochaeta perfilievii]|uniref:6-bladed beta-propeller n=1 Tax=Thiospirochaeta perfilievii TaxID=252967 RepID=A0A5C1QEG0_9SPIO|nr:hypothetical protein [Thiospirochaeta perfilievii]QEN05777.1 hypothetical protein EW093_14060 [Thiospirochaeta perfilievii]